MDPPRPPPQNCAVCGPPLWPADADSVRPSDIWQTRLRSCWMLEALQRTDERQERVRVDEDGANVILHAAFELFRPP